MSQLHIPLRCIKSSISPGRPVRTRNRGLVGRVGRQAEQVGYDSYDRKRLEPELFLAHCSAKSWGTWAASSVEVSTFPRVQLLCATKDVIEHPEKKKPPEKSKVRQAEAANSRLERQNTSIEAGKSRSHSIASSEARLSAR